MAKVHKTEIKIRSDHAQAVTGLKSVRSHAAKMVPTFSSVKTAMLLTTAAAAGLAVALFAVTKSTAETLDEQQKLADQLGVTTDFLSKMGFAADLSGIKSESLKKHIQKFTVAVGEAHNGIATYSDAFDELGLNLETNEGRLKTSEELILEVADAFENIDDSTKKVNLAYKLFGQRGTEMLQLLQQGRGGMEDMWQEAEKLGLVITKDAGEASAAFNDSLTRLTGSITGTKNSIALDLMPPMTKFFEVSAGWIADHRTDVMEMARDWATAIGGMALSAIAATATISDFFSKTGAALRSIQIDLMTQKLIEMDHSLDEMAANKVDLEVQMQRMLIYDETREKLDDLIKKQDEFFLSPGAEEKLKKTIQEIKDLLTTFEAPEIVRDIAPASEIVDTGLEDTTGPVASATQAEIDSIQNMWQEYYLTEGERLDLWYLEQQIKLEGDLANRLILQEVYVKKKAELDKAEIASTKTKNDVETSLDTASTGDFISNLETAGDASKEAFEAWKLGAIAQTIISTQEGAQKAFTALADIPIIGPALGIAAAAAAIAAGAARVASIKSQTYDGGGSVSSASAGSTTTPDSTFDTSAISTEPAVDTTGTGSLELTINDNRIAGQPIDPDILADFMDQLSPFLEANIADKVVNINVS